MVLNKRPYHEAHAWIPGYGPNLDNGPFIAEIESWTPGDVCAILPETTVSPSEFWIGFGELHPTGKPVCDDSWIAQAVD